MSLDSTPRSRSVLSDPAQSRSQQDRSLRAPESFTFWQNAAYEGLEITSARFTNHRFRPHTHEVLTVGLVDYGVKAFQRERLAHVAEPGSVTLVNAGELHTGRRMDGTELRYRGLYLPVALLREASAGADNDGPTPYFRQAVIRDQAVLAALSKAHSALRHRHARLLTDQLLLEAVRFLTERYGSVSRHREETRMKSIRQVRDAFDVLEARFCEDLSVSDIAISVGVSPFHLMRQFRKHFGIPMHALQTQLRVQFAKQLLQKGVPAAEVALETGFADQSHLSKRFKELVGTSPVAYQRNLRPVRQ